MLSVPLTASMGAAESVLPMRKEADVEPPPADYLEEVPQAWDRWRCTREQGEFPNGPFMCDNLCGCARAAAAIYGLPS